MRLEAIFRRRHRPAAACTIVARNFLSHARVLAESYLRHEPDARFYLLVVDGLPEGVDAGPGIHVIRPEELGFRNYEGLCFKYDVTELSTAVKPRLLSLLLDGYGEDLVAYFDPDILCARPLDELGRAASTASTVLIPHLLSPIPLDGLKPSEADLLISGTYNLGFIAVRQSTEARDLLQWWDERLDEGCRIDIDKGLFVDQKWMNLVPGYFPSTAILRDDTYNVAFWNLHERRLEGRGDRFLVNGQPLAFFHFSGFDPAKPRILSKHQTRTEITEGTALADLVDRYVDLQMRHGYRESIEWPYGYSSFKNGMPVHPILRLLYLELDDEERARFGNPFEVGEGSFLTWATTASPEVEGALTPFLEFVYGIRPDLQGAFPDPQGADREAFVTWAREHGAREHGYPAELAFVDGQSEPTVVAGNGSAQASEVVDYPQLVRRLREVAQAVLPADASVLVVSKGDEELLALGGRRALHFPQTEDGRYSGHHPANSEAAIKELEALREKGAEYLLLPATSLWWLQHYGLLEQHLTERYRVLARRPDTCVLWELRPSESPRKVTEREAPRSASVEIQLCPSPVFIIGSPRSGTTALAFALARHDNFWTSSEFQFIADLAEGDLLRNYKREGTAQGSWLRANGIHEAEAFRFLGLGVNALITSRSEGRRWIDHTPSQTLMAGALEHMFPGARFLHVLRDGRQVVNSMINFFSHERRTHLIDRDAEPWALDFREACATWRQYVEAAMEFCERSPDRCLTVHNERLVVDPYGSFREIFEFLDEPFDEDAPYFLQSNRMNSSFRPDTDDPAAIWEILKSDPWSAWTPEQRAVFVEEARDTLVRCGFADERDLALEEAAP